MTQTGCYYAHLAVGQAKLLWAREPVDRLLADPELDPALRARLELVQRAREFAGTLGLDVGEQYTSYVAWPHDRVVTNVIATQPGSIEAANFRFPIIGEVPYKGFFDRQRAEREAEAMRARGMDVCLSGIRAYSTLGWFDDPLTAPMLEMSEDRLVETVIHELVHATVFVHSQPEFNEGAAHFIGEEAVIRFYAGTPDADAPRARIEDERMMAAALMTFRERVAALYRDPLDHDVRRARRADLEAQGRELLAALPLRSRNASDFAKRARINDACLAIQGTYVVDTPKHRAVLDALGGDLAALVTRLREAARDADPRTTFFQP